MTRCWYDPDKDRVVFRVFANSIEEFILTPDTASSLRDEITKALDEREIRHPSWNI